MNEQEYAALRSSLARLEAEVTRLQAEITETRNTTIGLLKQMNEDHRQISRDLADTARRTDITETILRERQHYLLKADEHDKRLNAVDGSITEVRGLISEIKTRVVMITVAGAAILNSIWTLISKYFHIGGG